MKFPRVISTYILKATFISLLLPTLLPARAQQAKNIVPMAADTIPLFRGIQASVDLVGPAQLAFGSYGQYEGAVRVNLKDKYFPVVEVGLGKADADDPSTRLTFKTSKGRLGLQFDEKQARRLPSVRRIQICLHQIQLRYDKSGHYRPRMARQSSYQCHRRKMRLPLVGSRVRH